MRLLNTRSLELEMFMSSSSTPDYVILSHRWGPEECSFEDVTKSPLADPDNPARKKQGFPKLQGACDLARKDGYMWIWIDTCCIDKSSSAELQEAINSMWKYYAEGNICYAHLADVKDSENGWGESVRKSEWFTRGWTLQELIAPACVVFYANDWVSIGTKGRNLVTIAEITGITVDILLRRADLEMFSAAEKLSWAAHRNVTREEDEAYCLLGLFNVSIPLLYGEGRDKAFTRLQEAIYLFSGGDHTLFLYRHSLYEDEQPLLADSATRFCNRSECALCFSSRLKTVQCLPSNLGYGDIIPSKMSRTQAHESIMTTVTSTWSHISTTLPLLRYQDVSKKLKSFDNKRVPSGITHVAVLNCTVQEHAEGALCLLLIHDKGQSFDRVAGFPLLLGRLESYEGRLEKTKVLVSSAERGAAIQLKSVSTIFSAEGGQFVVQAWNVQEFASIVAFAHLPPNDGKGAMFEVHTYNPGRKSSPVVWCHLEHFQYPDLKLSVCLVQKDDLWSMTTVTERSQVIELSQKLAMSENIRLFDSCDVTFLNKQAVSTALRRLPSRCRGGSMLQYMYEIVVGPLSDRRGK